MSRQDLVDFIEKVSNDPKWSKEADMILLKERIESNHTSEILVWHVLDELRNICLDAEEFTGPTHGDAKEIIRIMKLYLD